MSSRLNSALLIRSSRAGCRQKSPTGMSVPGDCVAPQTEAATTQKASSLITTAQVKAARRQRHLLLAPVFRGPKAASLNDALLDPLVIAVDHLLGQIVAVLVGIFADAVEILPDAQYRLRVEIVDEHQHLVGRLAVLEEFLREDARRRDGEEIRADIGDATEQYLAFLQFRTELHHLVEQRARQLAAAAGDLGHVPGQPR